MDKIMLNSMKFYGFHGVFPEENKLGQRFEVDIVLYTDLQAAAASDDIKDSIDYGKVYETIQRIMETKVYQLLETIGETMAGELFSVFPKLHACTIKVIKPDPPIQGHYDSVSVEIYRERD